MMHRMRTTVTLEPDTEQIVRRLMRERNMTFKQAINEAIRSGSAGGESTPFRTQTASMGQPLIELDRALQLAASLEDDELIRRADTGS